MPRHTNKKQLTSQGLPKLKKPSRVKAATAIRSKLYQSQPPQEVVDISGDLQQIVPPEEEPEPGPSSRKFSRFQQQVSNQKKRGETGGSTDDEEPPSTRLSTRRHGTKVKFSKRKPSKGESKQGKDNNNANTCSKKQSTASSNCFPDYPAGTLESVEICQGFSKIKLEDWYPFFDFEFNKKCEFNSTGGENEEEEVTNETEDSDTSGDEWEETLVYVDLEDIPHAEALFSTLTENNARGPEDEESGDATEINMKMFNMDSQLPVLLLDGKYLAGQWQDTLGTSLFFKKKSQSIDENVEEEEEEEKLKNIVPEPEIAFDPVFGTNYSGAGTEANIGEEGSGYELVAKSFKVLKAKCFPVVNEEHKREDFIKDNDDEFDPRDFQIPPLHMIRKFTKEKNSNYEKYLERDLDRRRKIHEKWGDGKSKNTEEQVFPTVNVKPEPVEDGPLGYSPEVDTFLEEITSLRSEETIDEPMPGPSQSHI